MLTGTKVGKEYKIGGLRPGADEYLLFSKGGKYNWQNQIAFRYKSLKYYNRGILIKNTY